MYVDSLVCIKVKGGESGVKQGCIISPWLFSVYMDTVMRVKICMRRRGVKFLEEEGKERLPGLLCADDLVLCEELEEDLRAMVGYFAVVSRRGLKAMQAREK